MQVTKGPGLSGEAATLSQQEWLIKEYFSFVYRGHTTGKDCHCCIGARLGYYFMIGLISMNDELLVITLIYQLFNTM